MAKTSKPKTGKTSNRGKRGLNNVEKKEVKKMITAKKEVYYIPAYSYAVGRSLASGFLQGQLSNYAAFGHTTSGSISMSGLVVGNYLGGIAQTLNTTYNYLVPTGGIKLDGDSSNPVPILGDKAHVRSMKMNLRISALRVTDYSADDKSIRPLSFRVLAFKIKPNRPANIVPNLYTGSTTNPSLFLDNNNNDVGCNDFVVPYDVDSLRVNTQNIEVLRDIKFKLANPVAFGPVAAGSGGGGFIYSPGREHASTKDLSFWLPCPKKPVKYDSAKTPTNWDYRTYVLVICHREGGTYTQTQGFWDMESNMISRVQEF